jgi:hypothetical protein
MRTRRSWNSTHSITLCQRPVICTQYVQDDAGLSCHTTVHMIGINGLSMAEMHCDTVHMTGPLSLRAPVHDKSFVENGWQGPLALPYQPSSPDNTILGSFSDCIVKSIGFLQDAAFVPQSLTCRVETPPMRKCAWELGMQRLRCSHWHGLPEDGCLCYMVSKVNLHKLHR